MQYLNLFSDGRRLKLTGVCLRGKLSHLVNQRVNKINSRVVAGKASLRQRNRPNKSGGGAGGKIPRVI